MGKHNWKIIISGGGTGGHVFPAIAIADAIRDKIPSADILFVGAQGKIEMERVPKAGYPIKGLWISGFHRKLTLRNALFPLKLLSSLVKAWWIVRRFRPDLAIGVGGYASGPVLEVAARMGIPTLIQEQNSYAGVTNRMLSKKADKICVAYDHMEKYFPAEKLVLTGNPVRKGLFQQAASKKEGYAHFKLDPDKKTIFLFGGSLGARSLNKAVAANQKALAEQTDVQLIWQAGKLYMEEYWQSPVAQLPNVHIHAFIDRMDLAYAVADVVVCRAGALTISELCLVGKPAILVPSPNVAEDHQTKNAQALVEKDAALIIRDDHIAEELVDAAVALLNDPDKQEELSKNIQLMALPDAAEHIADVVMDLVNGS
jgi:UDP-N-acetylglucosamine--N-acetylmuramyl-(pentapeptide) pyrophosphoryl-undecaprenol N-acetylglucosamine transferase